MNLQPSHRRQDLPVRLGNHGYRLDGDHAVLSAELHVPPYFSGSSFGLELWACPAPHRGGSLEGVKIAEISLDLPTPIGPHVQHVETRTAVHPPAGSGDHSMVLVLVGGSGEARRIHDFANYDRPQHFESPQFHGSVSYSIDGEEVDLNAANVSNPRPEGNSSGTLSLELWASAEPYAGGILQGHRLAVSDIGNIWGQYQLPNVSRRVAFTAPPPGRWSIALVLREWTLAGYAPRDYRNFDAAYVQPAVGGNTAAAPVSPVASARAGEKLRLVELAAEVNEAAAAPAPVAAAPAAVAVPAAVAAPVAAAAPAAVAAAPAASVPVAERAPTVVAAPAATTPAIPASTSGKVSIHGATVEELAKLPGLSLKIAKEIVKNRPFVSIEALGDVRGIGEKTLRRIKSLLTL